MLEEVWDNLLPDYQLIEVLGEGSFGRVVRAKHRKSGKMVAIKYVADAFDNQYAARKILREVQILRKFSQMKNNVFTTKIYQIIVPGIQKNLLEVFRNKEKMDKRNKIDDDIAKTEEK